MKLELTKGSSRASGSVADENSGVVSNSGVDQNETKRSHQQMSHRRVDKRFSTYPKTTPLFQPGEGLFSTQLTKPSILKKPEVHKPIRVTDPPAPPLTGKTFQQQRTSAIQTRNRSQSPINNSRNRSAESRNRSTMNHTTPQFIYQPVPSSGTSGLPKPKLSFQEILWSGQSGQVSLMLLFIKSKSAI